MKTCTAADLMAKEVVSVGPTEPVETVVRLFRERRISAIPVVTGKKMKLEGIITKRDLIAHAHSWGHSAVPETDTVEADEESVRSALEGKGALVRDLMSAVLVTASPAASASELARLMRKHEIHHVPITDKGKLVGIVSSLDLIKLLSVMGV